MITNYNSLLFRIEHYQLCCNNKLIAAMFGCLNYNKFFIPCLEVSLTTFCTLCCKDCANLMQYYQKPYHVEAKTVLSDIQALVKATDGIDCLRLIGGEPLLWPDLAKVVKYAVSEKKINGILIVTNGTLLLPDAVCKILSKSDKCKVSISDYSEKSVSISQLIKQLKRNNIKFTVKKVVWKDKSDVSNRHKNKKQLMNTYRKCPNHFFSLLNGELHMCPRSSHGTDLGVFPKKEQEYVKISAFQNSPKLLRKRIVNMMNLDYITACNYCSEDISNQLPIVETAKQCSRNQAQARFRSMIKTL